MGIDFLELTFHIEKKHRMKFDKKAGVDALVRAKEDHEFEVKGCFGSRVRRGEWRVGRFFEVFREHLHTRCGKCGHVINGRVESSCCPNCSEVCATPELTWEKFCVSLGEVLLVDPAKISRDLWLIGDLGFS